MTSALFQVGYLFHKNRSYYIPLERYFDAESEKGLSHGVIIFLKKIRAFESSNCDIIEFDEILTFFKTYHVTYH